jgi:hypothetical protein
MSTVRVIGWVFAALFAAHALLLAIAAVPPLDGLLPVWLDAYLASDNWIPLAVQVLLGIALWLCFGIPRHRRGVSSSLGLVAIVGVASFVLAFASYASCSGDEAPGFSAVNRALSIFLGAVADPFGVVPGCAQDVPLALQAAQLGSLVALGIGVGAALALLFRSQLDRMTVRFAREQTVVIGYTAECEPMLKRIIAESPRQRRVAVLLEESDPVKLPAGTARIALAPASEVPVLPRMLSRSTRVRTVYVLLSDPAQALAWQTVCRDQLEGPKTPIMVVRIDDVWQAEYWRRKLISPDDPWLVDVVSPYEQTARSLVERLIDTEVDKVAVWGDSPLRLAVSAELAQRRREVDALRGRAFAPPVPTLIFVGEDAETAHRQHIALQRRFGNVDDVRSDRRPVDDSVLADIFLESARPALIMTDPPGRRATLASALVAGHPDWLVFAWEDGASGLPTTPVMEQLFPFGVQLGRNAEVDLHVWERVARLVHTLYLADPNAGPGPAHKPWEQLDPFFRESNLRLVTTTLASAVAVGRRWGPSTNSTHDGGHGVSPEQLEIMAQREHEDWSRQYRDAGWKYGSTRRDARRIHDRLLPWSSLDEKARQNSRGSVDSALTLLAALGYRSTEAATSDTSARYRRRGEVTAAVSDAAWTWEPGDGTVMNAEAGDWRVTDDSGREWSVKDGEFRRSYEHLGADRWRRTGVVTARPAAIGETISTLEGPFTVSEPSWVVRAASGVEWAVTEDRFRDTYEAV